jgi:hypothetical protein
MYTNIMFSMIRPVNSSDLARFGVLQGTESLPPTSIRGVRWKELELILPDRGLPRGVVEIASPIGERGALRGGGTTIALATVSAAQTADARAWCAWITPEDVPMLYAPAAVQAGVDLERLLVVRPTTAALARTTVKAAASGAFAIVVVDAFAGLQGSFGTKAGPQRRDKTMNAAVVVRKLALAAQELGTTTVLLTDVCAARDVPWPVALRLEVERRPEAIVVRVTKDRRGRASSAHVLAWRLGDAVVNAAPDALDHGFLGAASRPKRLASSKLFRIGDAG